MTKLKPTQQQHQRTPTSTLNHSKAHTAKAKGEGMLQFISFRERNGLTNDTRESNPTPAKCRRAINAANRFTEQDQIDSSAFFWYKFAFPEELAKPCVSDG